MPNPTPSFATIHGTQVARINTGAVSGGLTRTWDSNVLASELVDQSRRIVGYRFTENATLLVDIDDVYIANCLHQTPPYVHMPGVTASARRAFWDWCTFDMPLGTDQAVYGSNFSVQNSISQGSSDGFKANGAEPGDVQFVTNNYIRIATRPEDHPDGIQGDRPAGQIVISGNNIVSAATNAATGGIPAEAGIAFGDMLLGHPRTSITINANYIDGRGSAYALRLYDGDNVVAPPTVYNVYGNIFAPAGPGEAYALRTGTSPGRINWSNNRIGAQAGPSIPLP